MMVFTTNKNSPNVNNVIGRVNNTKIGFTKKLSNAKTTATVNAVVNSSTITPFMTFAKSSTKPAVINILSNSFIFFDLNFF